MQTLTNPYLDECLEFSDALAIDSLDLSAGELITIFKFAPPVRTDTARLSIARSVSAAMKEADSLKRKMTVA